MSAIDIDAPLRKPLTNRLKPATDRVTRERTEHPDRTPRDLAPHPVTPSSAERRHTRSEER
ncbi:MAG: hypothetical protein ACXW2G_01515 [Burkholderiaceae bacterium]